MKKEDKEFLKSLQHEMLTQDTVCQANPRFWVVMHEVKDYWVEEDNPDGIFVYYTEDSETAFEGDLKELAEWIKDLDNVDECEFDGCQVKIKYEDEEYSVCCTEDLVSFLDDYEYGAYACGQYRKREEIASNTFFLTLRECKAHIEANRYHYKENAHPYAMTAWRSPQVEKLYEILEKTDWDNV